MRPRCILKNQTYMVTRRTSQRQFLLRPSKEINECIKYCVANAALASKVQMHAVVFMSNHYHIVLTDIEGLLPVFTETLNRLLAKSLNYFHGRGENFWAGHVQPSHVLLIDRVDILNKLEYALSNPVRAGLVKQGKQWPGVRLCGPGTWVCKQPKFYFRDKEHGGSMPDKLKIKLSLPESLGIPKQAGRELASLIKATEVYIIQTRKVGGLGFLGKKAVLRQSVYDMPSSKDKGTEISPRIACRDKWRRIEVLQALKSFLESYKEALEDFKKGSFNVEFPAGSYKVGRVFGARISAAEC